METNDAGKAEKFFKDFGKKMDQFMAEIKEAGTRVEGNMQDRYEELKVAAEKLKTKIAGKK